MSHYPNTRHNPTESEWGIMTGSGKGHRAGTTALITDGATIATLIKAARAHAQDHQRMNDQNYHQHLDMKDVL
jgi:hypothetical protein